ncbi:MAG TPA: fibronectin type III domain-containing protein [Saprospiraceae bacterium]|nr:fibronectin type III domain-containing protein [Saprospiraceae bacterium]
MKKFIVVLIVSIVNSFSVSAQSPGDYRSIGSGNWNDPTKWETFNGSSWVAATTYPGQNPGTGAVTIMNVTEIILTTTVPSAISSLDVTSGSYCSCSDDNYTQTAPHGLLTFSSESVVSLTISEGVNIDGELRVEDRGGAKAHLIVVGGSLDVGDEWYAASYFYDDNGGYYEYYYYQTLTSFQTINQDDKINFIFNTILPNSSIGGISSIKIPFQDITFNGIGIRLETGIEINGTATFTNGIVRSANLCSTGYACDASPSSYCPPPVNNCGSIFFRDGAVVVGASANSFVDGRVWKRGDDPFTFPIGSGAVYSPLTASIPVGQSMSLSARYARSDAAYPISSGISDPFLYTVSDCEYWELNPDPTFYGSNDAAYPVDITVGWSNTSGCGSSPYVTNVSNVTLARLNFFGAQGWDNHGGSASGTNENGMVTWNGVTTLGTFTLGNMNSNCVPPTTLTATNITSVSATLNWSAVSGAVSYDVDYKRNTTERWTNIITATTTNSVNLSGLSAQYSYGWRVRANCNSSSSAYRLAKLTPEYPCGTPSGLNTTNITASSATLHWSPVTNATAYTVSYKESNSTSWVDAAINIGSTSFTLTGLSAATSYNWKVYALCNDAINYITYVGANAQAFFTSLACIDVYETNNTSSQAKAISVGVSVSAIISSANDIDWFKLTTPNLSYTNLQVDLMDLPADYDLYIYNKSLKLIGSSINSGISNEVVFYNSNARNATYFIKVIGKNGAYNAGCYHLQANVFGSGARTASHASVPANEVSEDLNKQFLYPNPASELVYLNFNSATEGLVNIQIVSSTGQLVKQHPVNTIKGQNQFKIEVADIRPGMYILRINKGDLNLTRKFVIAR